jgi:hypothetical protein
MPSGQFIPTDGEGENRASIMGSSHITRGGEGSDVDLIVNN